MTFNSTPVSELALLTSIPRDHLPVNLTRNCFFDACYQSASSFTVLLPTVAALGVQLKLLAVGYNNAVLRFCTVARFTKCP